MYRVSVCGSLYLVEESGVCINNADEPDDTEVIKPYNPRMGKDIRKEITTLYHANRFVRKVYGPHAIISDLKAKGFSADEIPNAKKIKAVLDYERDPRRQVIDEVEHLETMLSTRAFNGM